MAPYICLLHLFSDIFLMQLLTLAQFPYTSVIYFFLKYQRCIYWENSFSPVSWWLFSHSFYEYVNITCKLLCCCYVVCISITIECIASHNVMSLSFLIFERCSVSMKIWAQLIPNENLHVFTFWWFPLLTLLSLTNLSVVILCNFCPHLKKNI